MTEERYQALMDLGSLTPPDLTQEEIDLGWHWCHEFDGLLVGPGCSELLYCNCLEEPLLSQLKAALPPEVIPPSDFGESLANE